MGTDGHVAGKAEAAMPNFGRTKLGLRLPVRARVGRNVYEMAGMVRDHVQ